MKKTAYIYPTVKISSVEENAGTVIVRGTAKHLGQRKVEVIVNHDLNMRFVAENDECGQWVCQFHVSYNGEYCIEASVRDYSDFSQIRQTTRDTNYFMLEDAVVWGATVTKHTDGRYYMLFATWDKHNGFTTDWQHYSEIRYAVSTTLEGPYIYKGRALDASYSNTTHTHPIKWMYDGVEATLNVFHNPTVMHSEKDGKYYLYFMGTSADDMSLSYSRKRVGVAYANSPAGPWTILDTPLLDVRCDNWDTHHISNPSVTEIKNPDGTYTYYAVYKGSGAYEGQSLIATGFGRASSPLGPFERADFPIMRDREVGFSVEDCYVWVHNGRFYALAKDMTQGNWSGVKGAYAYALFESLDGETWGLSKHNLAFKNEILWASGTQKVAFYERSQLYLEKGIPYMLFNATTVNGKSPYEENQPYNVRTPLLGVEMSSDTRAITVKDVIDKTLNIAKLEELLGIALELSQQHFSTEDYKAFASAVFAAKVVLSQSHANQETIDFVAQALAQALAKKK